MTDLRKAAEMALEFVEWLCGDDHSVKPKNSALETREALRQALAEPANSTTAFVEPKASSQTEQEPLGGEWVPCVKLPVIVHVRNQRDGETHISTREGITPVLPEDLIMRGVAGEEYPIGRELFERTYTFDTAPPKQEWDGPTDEEYENFCSLIQREEAKLKEKNGG